MKQSDFMKNQSKEVCRNILILRDNITQLSNAINSVNISTSEFLRAYKRLKRRKHKKR